MGSASKKFVLSLVMTLLFLTVLLSLTLPIWLEDGEGKSVVKDLEGAPTIASFQSDSGNVVTRFPVRAFSAAANPVTNSASGEGETTAVGPGGLPTRTVPGVEKQPALGDRVTTRAYLSANTSVFERPQTTAQVLGRVGKQTKVRWLAKSVEGWEEILLKDGRSAYVQSEALSFSAEGRTQQPSFTNPQGSSGGPDLSTLPSTVENFLGHLSANDLLRAETYLSPLAPRLEEASLNGLASYYGVAAEGRVQRVELVSGARSGHRRVVLAYGSQLEHEIGTIWEWDAGQSRWMLVRWD